VSMGVEARCCPSKSTAHHCHMKRQPFLCNGRPRRGHHHCHCRRHLHCHHQLHCLCRRHCLAIAHRRCRHRCRQPLPLRLPLTITAAISVASPSAIAVTVALTVGHCRLRHQPSSQLPPPSAITVAMPLAISESCCLGVAKIVFNQLKQRMLTLFYFVQTVGGALIKAE
jgi:hypothetical protein